MKKDKQPPDWKILWCGGCGEQKRHSLHTYIDGQVSYKCPKCLHLIYYQFKRKPARKGVGATYYAIKHLPTGNYLPQLRKKRGHSHCEPMALKDAVPRLHKKRGSASVALWYWLKGAWHEDWQGMGYEVGSMEYDGNSPVHKPERKREEMEIVEMEVRERVRRDESLPGA